MLLKPLTIAALLSLLAIALGCAGREPEVATETDADTAFRVGLLTPG